MLWSYSLFLLEALLLTWYIRLFINSVRAWNGVDESAKRAETNSFVTVLIAMRNEEANIAHLLQSLANQSHQSFEAILLNDHSTDATLKVLEANLQNYPFLKCINLPEGVSGKKKALSLGVAQSKADWILCTDADCELPHSWINTMLSFAEMEAKVFVSGPVQFRLGSSWFTRWQALEFAGLISLGAAGIFRKSPTMCNGANILYRKDVFERVGGYAGNEEIASGDDQFLMHRIFEILPDAVGFCKKEEAIVLTKPSANIKDFISQRIRWASKNGQFERRAVSWEMNGVWMMSAFIILNLILAVFDSAFFYAFLLLILGKGIVEYWFYTNTLSFFKLSSLRRNFWLSELFQVIYVFCIALLGKFVRYEWKGRK